MIHEWSEERERERGGGERDTHRQTDRQTDREADRQTETETERQRQRDRERERERSSVDHVGGIKASQEWDSTRETWLLQDTQLGLYRRRRR